MGVCLVLGRWVYMPRSYKRLISVGILDTSEILAYGAPAEGCWNMVSLRLVRFMTSKSVLASSRTTAGHII